MAGRAKRAGLFAHWPSDPDSRAHESDRRRCGRPLPARSTASAPPTARRPGLPAEMFRDRISAGMGCGRAAARNSRKTCDRKTQVSYRLEEPLNGNT